MGRKKWQFKHVDKQRAARVAQEQGASTFAVLLLNSRGITDPEEIAEFFRDDAEFSDPFLIKDMDKAVRRISEAVDNGEKITVYGDYDCDGVTSTALLVSYLSSMGANVNYRIPERLSEGYGLNIDAVRSLAEEGTDLIITVDNGISAIAETELIHQLGMEIVVTDHHQQGDILPAAYAVVDPHRHDDDCPCKELAGVGVAFKLAAALEGGDYSTVTEQFIDIVALGTIADVVPLKRENRLIVKEGLKSFKRCDRPGLNALKNIAGCDNRIIDAQTIAFAFAPRINAAGRVGEVDNALRLLLSEDEEESLDAARMLDEYNTGRKALELNAEREVIQKIESDPEIKYGEVIVVDGERWHTGVIGIVASKIVEKYSRPAIILSAGDDGFAKGSGRSIEGFSLFEALNHCSDILVKFGGHSLAAGLTIERSRIAEFRRMINNYALSVAPSVPTINIDCRLNPAAINLDLVRSAELLEPFGAENPEPVFAMMNMTLRSAKSLGQGGNHCRMLFEREGAQTEVILFGTGAEELPFDIGDRLDLAVTLGRNEFHGRVSVNILLVSARLSAAEDDRYFRSAEVYRRARRGESLNDKERRLVIPDREFIGKVYRHIRSGGKRIYDPEVLAVKLCGNSAYTCKAMAALDILSELGLIKRYGRLISADESAGRNSLENSEILRLLKEG